jgi:hypothetical protein
MQFDQLKRREFITLLGGAAVIRPLAARARQPTMPMIGFLGAESPDSVVSRLRAFRQGLSETDAVEGHNVAIDGGRACSPTGGSDLCERSACCSRCQSSH